VFFIFAIIAFYGIGRILVFLWFFGYHRFLQHKPGYWYSRWFFAIVAFYSIGRILIFITFRPFGFSSGQDL